MKTSILIIKYFENFETLQMYFIYIQFQKTKLKLEAKVKFQKTKKLPLIK